MLADRAGDQHADGPRAVSGRIGPAAGAAHGGAVCHQPRVGGHAKPRADRPDRRRGTSWRPPMCAPWCSCPIKSGRLVPSGADAGGFALSVHDEAVAKWVLEHGQTAGRGTATLPGSEGVYLPLPTSRGTVGVLGVIPSGSAQTVDIEQLHLLEAFAGLIALALERADLEAGSRSDSAGHRNRAVAKLAAQRRVARPANAAVGHHRGQQHAVGERPVARSRGAAGTGRLDPGRIRAAQPAGGEPSGHDPLAGRGLGSAKAVAADRRGHRRRAGQTRRGN